MTGMFIMYLSKTYLSTVKCYWEDRNTPTYKILLIQTCSTHLKKYLKSKKKDTIYCLYSLTGNGVMKFGYRNGHLKNITSLILTIFNHFDSKHQKQYRRCIVCDLSWDNCCCISKQSWNVNMLVLFYINYREWSDNLK